MWQLYVLLNIWPKLEMEKLRNQILLHFLFEIGM